MKKFLTSQLIVSLLFLSFVRVAAQNDPSNSDNQSSPSSITKRPFQISFVPYFGTNGFRAPEIINHVSLNILAGYNGGTTGLELGGLLNIDKYDVTATQIAGIGNHAGQSLKGVQIGGIYNIARMATGTQIAGITNIATDANGLQIGGISNQTITGKTGQIGGISNITLDKAIFQIAGINNYARSSNGVQIAGIMNIAKESTGNQIAGILNVAHTVRGVQIGLINISDTCKGVPIGLINIVKNGYRRFEISGDELFQTNIAFRSGVDRFHAILTAGIQPDDLGAPLWSYGSGFGTSQALSAKTLLDFDVTFHQVIKNDRVDNNHLYRAYLGIDHSLGSHLSLAVGVTYNFLSTDMHTKNYDEYYSDIEPYSFTNHNYSRYNVKSWAGLKVGLRFR
jgi:hypothetical protein